MKQSSYIFFQPLLLDIDKNIHEPARLKILTFLRYIEEADFITLMEQLALTKGNLSSHLLKLEKGGYISIKKTFINKFQHTTIVLTSFGRKSYENYKQQILEILSVTDSEKLKVES